MGNANIIDVSEETFDFEVLNYSTHVPVVVDLWAPWCIPCRVQSELLAKLADEADGAFRLARINVDEQSRLAKRLKVNDLPGIKPLLTGAWLLNISAFCQKRIPASSSTVSCRKPEDFCWQRAKA